MPKTKTQPDETKAKSPKVKGVSLRSTESVEVVGHPALSSVWYKYLLTLGLYNIWRRRNIFVLTDQRVFLAKGVWNRREQSIPLHHIEDASYVRRGTISYCEVSSRSPGDSRTRLTKVGPLRWSIGRRFARGIDERT
jgi:Bacterial PH domain